MKLSFLLPSLLGATFVLSRDQRLFLGPGTVSQSRVNSKGSRKFIVEVEQDRDVASIAHQLISKTGRKFGSYRQFDCSDLFTGFVVDAECDNADSLLQMEGVVNVWPMATIPKPCPEKSPEFSPLLLARNYSLHRWTGVDKLHARGIRGKGATVAIIDTGIDYTHKALGGCFGPGCKVAGGYDLVGADWDEENEKLHPKKPDDDPMDFHGHGTHVAGIIAADNSWLTGVAPDAELLIYKVFSDDPWETNEETIMQGLCDAYNAGADVITSSIGQPNGFSDNPWALLGKRLVDKGVVVISSAGNEGETGPFYSSMGAMGHGVLAVAAANVSTDPRYGMRNESVRPMPAYFTSWGPSNELLVKPDVAAPGFRIVSTVLNQSYDELSGTSMSAPYIAGVAALFIGEHGGREFHGSGLARMLHDRIVASGGSLPWVAGRLNPNFTAPPFQVGTGLVNASKVLDYDTQLEFEPFALMDTELFRPTWRFNVTNNRGKRSRYTFELEPQAGVNIMDSFYGISPLYELKPRRIAPGVTLPPPVVIKPGGTKEVEVTFQLPKVDDDYLPLYGGKVWVVSDLGERLSIPYGGAAYDTEKAFDNMFITDPVVTEMKGDWSWSFNVAKDPNDFIEIGARLSYPCTHLRWDIFDQSWTESLWHFPPEIGERGFVGSATTYRDSDEYWFFNPRVNDKDDTLPFPLRRVPRGFRLFWWFGKFANGTQIAPGNYTMRFAALRPYGNPNISDHWDVMYNQVKNIQILPMNGTSNSTHTWHKPSHPSVHGHQG